MFVWMIIASQLLKLFHQIWHGDVCNEPEHYVKRLLCYLQGHGHSEGSYNQN